MKLLAIVGMPGSGKSTVAEYFKNQNLPVLSFGDLIREEILKRGLEITPLTEPIVREEIRNKYGMDACVKLSLPWIQAKLMKNSFVIIDGIRSFSEYKSLKKEFGDKLVVLALFTSKHIRYKRLASRIIRPFKRDEAEARDYREIEKIELGGTIAIADFMIINDGLQEELFQKVETLLTNLVTKVS
ncbi:AAA family ATPase [Nostoc sp. WHI]|uniref:AAA family ATPase n=1 Tax=Nostoc sp. WHI TaxID=2650611 RepID=UPI0018C59B72|nr:AAA family ATPase [Nostoc sp. WHI]MBG1268583.1 AAA family ATPase [Nostoc sp. WHI]